MKSLNSLGSIGNQIMITQQQVIHQKKLKQINNKQCFLSSKTFNYDYLMKSSILNQNKISKKTFHQQFKHYLTLKHLIQRINSPKSFNQRLKNQHDFIAYPSLFFRKTQSHIKKKINKNLKTINKISAKSQISCKKPDFTHNMIVKNQLTSIKNNLSSKKKQNKANQQKKSGNVSYDKPQNGLILQKVIEALPYLQKFEKKDFDLFTGSLNQLICKYNLNKMVDIEFLFDCVQKYLPQHYPKFFVKKIQDFFEKIVKSL